MAWSDSDCRMFAATGALTWMGNTAGSNLAEQTAAKTNVKENLSATANAEQPDDKEKTSTVIIRTVEKTTNGFTRNMCEIENVGGKQVLLSINNKAAQTLLLPSNKDKKFSIRYNPTRPDSRGQTAWFVISAEPVQG